MKRSLLTLLACCLVFSFGALAEQSDDLDDILNTYSGVAGRIAFALPGVPEMLPDHDKAGYWKNSVQLAGNASDGQEFQFRTADIGEWLNKGLEERGDRDPDHARADVVVNYASFVLFSYGGEIKNPSLNVQEDHLRVGFDYTYPDSPGKAYRCEAVLAGDTVALLMGEVCPDLEAAFERLMLVSEEEARAFHDQEPAQTSMGILSMVFPRKPFLKTVDDSHLASCFAQDFTLLSVNHIPQEILVSPEVEGLEEALRNIAKKVMLPSVQGSNLIDPVMSFPAKDTVCLAFTTISEASFGESFGQRFLCRMYLSERGVYYLWAADTDTGRAFLESIRVSELSQ